MCQSILQPSLRPSNATHDVLTEILRDGARTLLAQAIQAEVAAWIAERASLTDEAGHRLVVRNGCLPRRVILTGVGPIEVEQPRVHDRRLAKDREKFTSAILPPYLRKTRSLEELIPWLYLKGISTGDFSEALQALLGPEAAGLSPSTITRLKTVWEQDYQAFCRRSLEAKRYAYIWVDGVHFNIRLESGERQCILVLMGATADGKKELIAIADGYRESEQSWKELLLDVKARGQIDRSQAGDRRWGPGILESGATSVPIHTRAAMHGSQDSECPGQAAQGRPGQGQGGLARDLAGRDARRSREGVRSFCEDIPGQVSEGGRVPGEGSGRVAGVLRFPGGALAAHPLDQRDRKRVRDGASAARQDQGQRQPHGLSDNGL